MRSAGRLAEPAALVGVFGKCRCELAGTNYSGTLGEQARYRGAWWCRVLWLCAAEKS